MKMLSFLKKYWLFVLLGIFVIFIYTANLDKNSRFIWDESRALVDMHRIWEQKQITFVGPISEDRLEMFPSLSYYMYMPATALTNFDPLGPAYMAAFWGIIAWLVLTITLIKKVGSSFKTFLMSLLSATIYPVVVASRWAWNPNLVIFWMTLFITTLFYEIPFITFLGGMFLGASLYHHYLAIFGIIPTLLFLPIIFKGSPKKNRKMFLTLGGFLVSLTPFVLFELKNHYYLNSLSFLSANDKSFTTLSGAGYFDRLWNALVVFANMFVPNVSTLIISFLLVTTVIFFAYRKDKYIRFSFLSLLLSFALFGVIKQTYLHYQYVQVPLALLLYFRFFIINKKLIGKIIIGCLLLSSLVSVINLVNSYTWQGDITAIRNVTTHLVSETSSKANVAALASPDPNLYGQRFRDMALINGKELVAFDKFPQSEVLYVVSATDNPDVLRNDHAWEIESFKGSTITDIWKVSDYPLYLYRFAK